jgi:hypothetical protein
MRKKKNIETPLEDSVVSDDSSSKKRKKYITQKSIKLDNLLESAKEYKFNYKPASINLVKDVEETKRLTDGTCLRPDIYLDNDGSCDGCYIFNNCICGIKKLKKKK